MKSVKTSAARYRFGRSLKPFRWPWLWLGLWSVGVSVVVAGSLLPPPNFTTMPAGGDKWLHFLAYGLLSAAAVQLFRTRLALLSALISLAAMGFAIEWAQGALTHTRQLDMADAVANCVGVWLGLGSYFTPWRDALLRLENTLQRRK